jgi:hypothetical protein
LIEEVSSNRGERDKSTIWKRDVNNLEKANRISPLPKMVVSRNAVRLEDVTRLVLSLNPSPIEALIA